MTDITLCLTPRIIEDACHNEKVAFLGHVGTHFDVMNKVFPLLYTEREAVVFDVSHVGNGEISTNHIDMSLIESGMFVIFATGFIEKEGYATPRYFREHPTLSIQLIKKLIEKGIALIGVDFAGIRRGTEHTPTDQLCADNGVFVIENLCNLLTLLNGETTKRCHVHTYPINITDMSGLPCRVVVD